MKLTDIEIVKCDDHAIVEALTDDGGVCQARFDGPLFFERANAYAAALSATPFRPKVLIHQDKDGEIEIVAEPGADALWVDDRIPQDRVFRMSPSTAERVNEILGDDQIGHAGDEVHQQFKAKLHFHQHGLKLVEKRHDH